MRPSALLSLRRVALMCVALMCVALSTLLSLQVALAKSGVSLSVNRAELSVQQTLRATVEVNLDGNLSGANIQEPDWAQQGWTVIGRSQQSAMQIFNSQRSLTITYSYQLKPTQTGTLTLGPFRGAAAAEGLDSEVVHVKVYDGPPQVSEAQKRLNNRYAVMRWEVDERSIWLGERVDVTLALYVNTDLRITQYIKPDLDLSGAWLEDVEVSGRSKRARIGSDIYFRKEAEHKLLSPLKAGTFTLPKLSTGLTLSSLGFGRREESLTVLTPAQTIEVKPLPPNPPKGFKGPTVGDVKLEAIVDRTRLRADEGVQLTIKTSTDGLLHNTPPLELPYIEGLKSFTPTMREKKTQHGDRAGAVRSQTWLLKPTKVGTLKIPSIQLPFFNPQAGEYQLAKTPVITLVITGDAELLDPSLSLEPPSSSGAQGASQARESRAVSDLGVSLKSIRSEALPLAPQSDLRWPLRLLALLSLGLWLRELLKARLKGIKALGSASSTRKTARAVASAQLKELQAYTQLGNPLDHAQVDELLRTFLERRFSLELRGLTRAQVAEQLRSVQLQRPHIDGYEALCERLDFLRFSGGTDQGAQGELLTLAQEWVQQVDLAPKAPAQSGGARLSTIALLLTASLTAPIASAAPQETLTERAAHEAFWAGDLNKAVSAYQSLLKARPSDPNLWYNLGTAQAHLGRFGEASYALHMGLSQAPHDDEARAQLERVNQASIEDGVRRPGPRRLVLPDEVTSSGGLLAFVSAQGAESALLLALSLLGLCLWLLQRSQAEDPPRVALTLRPLARVSSLLLAALCVASGAAWWLRHSLVDQQRLGVVVEPRAPLRRGPAERFPAEVNIAGAVKVKLQGVEGGWQRVVLFDGREGWLSQSHVRELK